MTRPALRVAVAGPGTVGGEVARALLAGSPRLAPADGRPLELAAVVARSPERALAAGIPAGLVAPDGAALLAGRGCDVLVETIGGDGPARALVVAALEAGIPVVTANKLLLALHGPELEATARRTGAALRFEAAVGGGTPVLGPIAEALAANRLERVRGIVNGTTNVILTAMTREGRAYGEVLGEAQRLGYAEADPTADVEGLDARNKLVVLVRFAFGAWIDPASIGNRPVAEGGPGLPGITGVTAADVAALAAAGRLPRLVAGARLLPDGTLEASVLPSAVAADGALGRCDGVLNRVEVATDLLGTVAFEGPGAGGAATSSAVLGDLVAVARGLASTWAGLAPATTRSTIAVRAPEGETVTGPSGARYPLAAEGGR